MREWDGFVESEKISIPWWLPHIYFRFRFVTITFEPFELETSDLAPKWAIVRRMGGYCLKWEKLYSKVTAAYLLPVSFLTIIFEFGTKFGNIEGNGWLSSKVRKLTFMMAAAYVLLLSFFDRNVWTVWARNFKFVMNIYNNEAMSIRRCHPHFSFGIAFCCVVIVNAIFQNLLS